MRDTTPVDEVLPSNVRIKSCHGHVEAAVDHGTLRLRCVDSDKRLFDIAVPECHRLPAAHGEQHDLILSLDQLTLMGARFEFTLRTGRMF
ncbi:MAG: hypothetical protein ACPG1A_16860, partial [Halioglobus sp.]